MSEENKAIVRRYIEQVWNEGQLAVVEEIYGTDYVLHDPGRSGIRGSEGLKQFVAMYRTGFPDVRWTVEDQIAEGEKVVTRYTARGTHKGEFVGIGPTGRQATVTGILISRFAGGEIVEEWVDWDFLGLLQQMGVIPRMGESGE